MKSNHASSQILPPPEPATNGIHRKKKKEEKPDSEKKKRKVLTFSLSRLRQRKYESIDLGEYYTQLFGIPEPRFSMMCYGASGSGKSRFCYGLAEFLGKYFGKVIYMSYEEATKKTVVDRANTMKMKGKRLWFCEGLDFDDLLDLIRRKKPRFLFIDSTQYARLTFEQLIQIQTEFRKRKLSIILVSWGTAWMKPADATSLLFACDIKCYFNVEDGTGRIMVSSRYLPEIIKAKLFSVQELEIELTEPVEEELTT